MARRVLSSGIGLIMALVLGNTGCVIGVPVEQKPIVTNHPPVIEKTTANPSFGPITSSVGETIEFLVNIDDEDEDDQLFVRLFRQVGMVRTRIPASVATVPSGDVLHPTRRNTTVAAAQYCDFFGPTTTVVFVVADVDFTNDISDQTPAGGLSDEALWVLTCAGN
jgi:hypothetical protein